jgi:hypothetical protein
MYEFVGKSAPFLILSALALGDGCKYKWSPAPCKDSLPWNNLLTLDSRF